MSEFVEFGLLGPLLVRSGGAEIQIRRGHQRTLLALLLLEANQVVPVDTITEALWGAAPPVSAPVSIRGYIRWLRLALGKAGQRRISTEPRGYLIRVADGELDVVRFERLLASARAAARGGSWQEAAEQSREALSCWRGEPLADIESETMALRDAPRLAELRLQAIEIRIDADLRLGGHADVIAELRRLCAAHPLREHLHALLLLALYRCGRQGEALAAYQHARAKLVEDLGVEPGAELSILHERILAADSALAVPDPAPVAAGGATSAVPRELPLTVPGFTGRSAELRALTGLLGQAGAETPGTQASAETPGTQASADTPGTQASADTPGTVVISAIGGTAGVGKTALAVHWAHQVAGRFPDGQLYVNLRGYDPAQPMPAADALAGFLYSLGVPGQDIPPEEDQRAARYRSLLAGKRMLIVLDNARTADQVRPLLPGTLACTVVVTSRDALSGLVARDGATRLDLDVLPHQDAVALLRTLIGTRVDAEPAAAAELAAQCSRLPLALRIAAELAASRPAATLAELTAELADLHTRLDLLAPGGDPRTQVRTVFSWSCRHLGTEHARMFRLLGMHPGPDLDLYAAAALSGVTVPQARRALAVLARAHLIQPTGPDRYTMHDLLRGYARELASDQDTAKELHAALTRLFDHYLHTAATAMDTMFPAERDRRPRIPRPATPIPPLADPAAARHWLDAERAALLSTAGHTAAHGWPSHATRLAVTISRYLRNDGHFPEALTIFGHALDAARQTGDHAAEAAALNQIGLVDLELCRFQQAADHHQRALTLFRAAADRAGEAYVLGNIGINEAQQGRYEQAARHQQGALAIYRDIGDRFGQTRAIGNLGFVRLRQGRYQEAAEYQQQTLDLSREMGDRHGEAYALSRLGGIERRLGRYQQAAGYIQQALGIFHEIGSKADKGETMCKLGEVYVKLGRYEQAAGSFEQALVVARDVGDPGTETDALNGLGEVLVQTGGAGKAREHHVTALRLASEIGSPAQRARAHSGLARAYHAEGDLPQARHHWREALTRYTAIGAPEADEIRAELAMAGDHADDGHS